METNLESREKSRRSIYSNAQSCVEHIWRVHITNKELYDRIPKIIVSIREQRLRFIGHCWRSKSDLCKRFTSLATAPWSTTPRSTSNNVHYSTKRRYWIHDQRTTNHDE